MKKHAWTMGEMIIAISVLLVLTGLAVRSIKNLEVNKAKISLYAAIRHLTMGTLAVSEKDDFRGLNPKVAVDWNNGNSTDWYCLQLADAMAIKSSVNCAKNTTSANFTTANGMTFYGLADAWSLLYGDAYYKNVLVDINDTEKPNKIGHDKFPLRVYRGMSQSKISLDGVVYPADCSSETFDTGSGTTTLTHTDCGGSTNKFASSIQHVTYDIYKVMKVNSGAVAIRAQKIHTGLSLKDADCLAYGDTGLYGGRACKSIKDIHQDCAHPDTCEECETHQICPNNGSKANCDTLANDSTHKITYTDPESGTTETENFPCFTLMSKPTGGLGMIGGSIISELGI